MDQIRFFTWNFCKNGDLHDGDQLLDHSRLFGDGEEQAEDAEQTDDPDETEGRNVTVGYSYRDEIGYNSDDVDPTHGTGEVFFVVGCAEDGE